MAWNPLQSFMGLLSRKQQDTFKQLEAKAKGEGKTAYGKLEELAAAYVSGAPAPLQGVRVAAAPLAVAAVSPSANSPLQYELEKTKATLQAAFELSDMLRPQQAEGGDDSELLGSLVKAYFNSQAQESAGKEQVIEQALGGKKSRAVGG